MFPNWSVLGYEVVASFHCARCASVSPRHPCDQPVNRDRAPDWEVVCGLMGVTFVRANAPALFLENTVPAILLRISATTAVNKIFAIEVKFI
jgi:hypothetical protein